MNSLVYTEESKLIVEKPNGLKYEFDNVDAPDLGFEYDMIVYDDIEVKVLKWDDNKGDFNSQDKIPLTNEEKDAIETYIANSEPPIGWNLNNQYLRQINEICHQYVDDCSETYGFQNHIECTYGGREGSAHPYRSNAKRVLEYADAVWCIYVQIADEIQSTREDLLKSIDECLQVLPEAQQAPDSRQQ